MTPANDRTSVGSVRHASPKDEYGTPADLYARLDRVWQFDYDPAATHENAKARLWSTKDGTFKWVYGEVWAVRDADGGSHDGLAYDWSERRVFVNPPFSDLARWVAKMDAERARVACLVAILPDARDTTWWRDHVQHKAIDIPIRPRTRFIHPPFECEEGCTVPKTRNGKPVPPHVLGAPMGSPPGGICVVEFRPDWLLP